MISLMMMYEFSLVPQIGTALEIALNRFVPADVPPNLTEKVMELAVPERVDKQGNLIK